MFSNSEEAATKHNYGHEGKWEELVSFLNMQKDKGKMKHPTRMKLVFWDMLK